MNAETEDSRDYDLYRRMLLIRRTEELLLRLFSEGQVSGTTHTCIGQEADCVGVIGHLDPERDTVVSNHRNHGHFLAFGGPVSGLIGEVMGRETGVCSGRGGSQHLKHGRFISSGVLGGGIPTACGIALGEKRSETDGLVVACLGDGTMGEGVLYESLNMAALWELPIVFFVENNRYAQTTPIELAVAGSIRKRGEAFGLATSEIESTDVREIDGWGRNLIERVRTEREPIWAVVHTYRLSPHSKGDDNRAEEEIERYRKSDPLEIQAARVPEDVRAQLEVEVEKKLERALARARGDRPVEAPV